MKRRPRLFYGWVIVAEAIIAISIAYGIRYSFPAAFYPTLLDEFGWTRASTASIFSVFIIIYGLLGPVAGALIDRFGPRRVYTFGAVVLVLGAVLSSQAREIWHFYFTFGLLMALGTGMLGTTPHTTILSNWFDRRRGMAFGFINAGTGLSSLFAPLAQYLILSLGWPSVYLIFAGLVALVLLPLVALVPRHRPQDMGLLPDGAPQELEAEAPHPQREQRVVLDQKWAAIDWTLLKATRTYRFWGVILATLLGHGIGWQLIMTHQVRFLQDVGFGKMFAVNIFALYGVMATIGTLFGFISDRIGREATFTIGSIGAMLGIVFLLLIGDTSQPWLPLLYAIAFGLGLGISQHCGLAALADLFQGKHLGPILGSIVLGFALGGFIGPWLGGYIYDHTGSYTIPFILAIAVWAAGVPFIWLAGPGKVRPVMGRMKR